MKWLETIERMEDQHIPARGLVVSVAIVFAVLVIDRLVQLGFSRVIRGQQAVHHDDAATRLWLTRRLSRAMLWLLALATVASQFNTLRTLGTTLLASAGVVGVVVGVAARSTFANIVAGVQIAFTQPIRVGDVVGIRDEVGEVEDISLTYTFIKTGDNRRLAIPNDVLSNEIIKNFSLRDPASLASAQLSVAYSARLDEVRALLTEAVKSCPAWDPERPPAIAVAELTDTAVRLKIFAWAKTPWLAFDLNGQLREAGLRALQAAQVPLPASVVVSRTEPPPKASPIA